MQVAEGAVQPWLQVAGMGDEFWSNCNTATILQRLRPAALLGCVEESSAV